MNNTYRDSQNTMLHMFYAGIENERFLTGNIQTISLLRGFIRIIGAIMYISIHRNRKVHITVGSNTKLIVVPLHERILKDIDYHPIYIKIKEENSLQDRFVNYIPFSILVNSLFSIPSRIVKEGYVYNWFFFYILYNFVKTYSPNKVYVAGHYDKYMTWLSYICENCGVQYHISQHGVCGKYDLPYKIPADFVDVFSESEKEIFKCILKDPSHTQFSIKGYFCSFTAKIGNLQRNTIAIASQPGYESIVKKIISTIYFVKPDASVVIYSHPRDYFRKLDVISVDNIETRIIHNDRYIDIAILIIITSTIAYDYLAIPDFSGLIVCYHVIEGEYALYYNNDITMVEPKDFEFFIKTYFCNV